MLDKMVDEASDTAEIAADQLLLEALIKRMDKLAPGIFRALNCVGTACRIQRSHRNWIFPVLRSSLA